MSDQQVTEAPVLSLERLGVCLHFLETGPTPQGKAIPYPDCPVLRSMELDLLSYRFQLDPPIGSQCESHLRLPVKILFPERLEYVSEGRRVTLVCPDPERRAEVILSSTQFPISGVRVWHAVLSPTRGDSFTEFDVIKLIQLYDGRTEGTHLADQVRFELADGRRVSPLDLPSAISPRAPAQLCLRAGTVQILLGDASPHRETLPRLLTGISASFAGNNPPAPAEIPDPGSPAAQQLAACAGIVSGIFDFEEMDYDEICDVLEPTVPDTDGVVRVHRCTLSAIASGDRAMETCEDTVGVSPYLLIPHAALLHNEAMVDAADAVLEQVLSDPRPNLRRLEAAHERSDQLLNRYYLANVFNYRTERTLFQKGAAERGSDERRVAALARLSELDSRISQSWEERKDRGQMCIAILLALISVVQLKDMVFTLVGSGSMELRGWGILGGGAALLALLIAFFWRLGARR